MQGKTVPGPNRSIFRSDALRRYQQRREQAVLPRFVSPRAFVYLWILVGLLLFSGFLAWFAQIPVYAAGPAVVVAGSSVIPNSQDEIALVVFLPSANISRLRPGQLVFLQFTPGGERLSRPIVAVEPQIISPESAQQQFKLSAGAAQVVVQPAAVAVARLEPIPTGLPAAAYIGSIYRVDMQVGSRRLLSLFPLIGRLFE